MLNVKIPNCLKLFDNCLVKIKSLLVARRNFFFYFGSAGTCALSSAPYHSPDVLFALLGYFLSLGLFRKSVTSQKQMLYHTNIMERQSVWKHLICKIQRKMSLGIAFLKPFFFKKNMQMASIPPVWEKGSAFQSPTSPSHLCQIKDILNKITQT